MNQKSHEIIRLNQKALARFPFLFLRNSKSMKDRKQDRKDDKNLQRDTKQAKKEGRKEGRGLGQKEKRISVRKNISQAIRTRANL